MMSKSPNYAYDRSQRERAQQAKANEKATRRADELAKRKASKDDSTGPQDDSKPI